MEKAPQPRGVHLVDATHAACCLEGAHLEDTLVGNICHIHLPSVTGASAQAARYDPLEARFNCNFTDIITVLILT